MIEFPIDIISLIGVSRCYQVSNGTYVRTRLFWTPEASRAHREAADCVLGPYRSRCAHSAADGGADKNDPVRRDKSRRAPPSIVENGVPWSLGRPAHRSVHRSSVPDVLCQ